MGTCKHYSIFTWAEPPLEPDENGTHHSEGKCDRGVILNEVYCGGDKDLCDLLAFDIDNGSGAERKE